MTLTSISYNRSFSLLSENIRKPFGGIELNGLLTIELNLILNGYLNGNLLKSLKK